MKDDKQTFGIGPWNVDFHPPEAKLIHGKIVKKRRVEMLYLGKVYFKGSGKVAYDNAVETVKHLYRTGYVPKSASVNCGADMTAAQKMKAAKQSSPDLMMGAE